MRSGRAILSLKYTPVAARGGVRQAVGAFLRYIQYRDQHVDARQDPDVGRLLRYVAHRDRSSAKGRLFTADRLATDDDRRQLAAYVVRSTAKMREPKEGVPDTRRAVYRMVISPEDAAQLDLRLVTRAAMAALEDAAGPIPPWIAAEHRNTAHPHVHVVLAARRETSPGHFRSVLITRPRLAAMKQAMQVEILRQREELEPGRGHEARAESSRQESSNGGLWWALSAGSWRRRALGHRLQNMARKYRRELDRQLEGGRYRRDLEFAR